MADIIPQQILVPKKVYIGDTAELRCTFNIIHPALREKVSTGTIQIPVENFVTQPDTNDCDIKSIHLMQAGVDHYQVVITFVPWTTGNLQLPPLSIEDVSLILQPVQIVSISEQNNATVLKEPMSPLLLPGTTYKIYGALVALIILIFILIQLIVKRKSVIFFLKTKKLQRKYRQNKKITIKKLNALPDEKRSADEIQKILRQYMEVRFDYPFTKAVTSELMEKFNFVTQGLLPTEKIEAFGELVSVFLRTDYIRYSSQGSFAEGEKTELVNKCSEAIEIIEQQEEKNA